MLLNEAFTLLVFVDAISQKPIPIPNTILSLLTSNE
jgi:acyl-CoA thioesterase FadM